MTPKEHREQRCINGIHAFTGLLKWFREFKEQTGTVKRVDVSGRHCQHCGKWKVES